MALSASSTKMMASYLINSVQYAAVIGVVFPRTLTSLVGPIDCPSNKSSLWLYKTRMLRNCFYTALTDFNRMVCYSKTKKIHVCLNSPSHEDRSWLHILSGYSVSDIGSGHEAIVYARKMAYNITRGRVLAYVVPSWLHVNDMSACSDSHLLGADLLRNWVERFLHSERPRSQVL